MNLTEQYPSDGSSSCSASRATCCSAPQPMRPTYGRCCCAYSLTGKLITNQRELLGPAS